jgi:hypothetical protein
MDDPGRIDDSVDAARAAWTEEPENVMGETALSVLSAFFPPAAAYKAVKDQFSNDARFGRIQYFFDALAAKVNALELRIGSQAELSQTVRAVIDSTEFKEAMAVALEETVRTPNTEKAEQFSSILVGSLDPSIIEDSPAKASSLIRDVAQLDTTDLQVLGILRRVYGHLFPPTPSYQDPNAFTEQFQDFKDAVTGSGILTEEFQSVCERLRGFGLAAEVLRNPSRMSPTDYCYRPTRRGLKLLTLLGQRSAESAAANASDSTEHVPSRSEPPPAQTARRVNIAVDNVIKEIDYWMGKVANPARGDHIPPTNTLDFRDEAANLDRAEQLPGQIAELMASGYEKLRRAKSEIDHAREWKPGARPQSTPMPPLLEARNLFMEVKKLVLAILR